MNMDGTHLGLHGLLRYLDSLQLRQDLHQCGF